MNLRQKDLAELFDKYNLYALAVVDSEGSMVGVVQADHVISFLREIVSFYTANDRWTARQQLLGSATGSSIIDRFAPGFSSAPSRMGRKALRQAALELAVRLARSLEPGTCNQS